MWKWMKFEKDQRHHCQVASLQTGGHIVITNECNICEICMTFSFGSNAIIDKLILKTEIWAVNSCWNVSFSAPRVSIRANVRAMSSQGLKSSSRLKGDQNRCEPPASFSCSELWAESSSWKVRWCSFLVLVLSQFLFNRGECQSNDQPRIVKQPVEREPKPLWATCLFFMHQNI